ncbi:DUF1524 domain-containing protein [Puerhibacterium sp. TATVAM-FAB25]|uniref:GmrSD restriction endonuclease domain-containing protein n=1 Tax=Puerhibacterium sp. TATVAM-FAB25 TaxID=3093699 RepID=UPI00397B9DDB
MTASRTTRSTRSATTSAARRPVARLLGAGVAALLALGGCAVETSAGSPADVSPQVGGTATPSAPSSSPDASAGASAGTTTPDAGPALAAARELTVKGRAPKTGYDRANFGAAWADVDHNGCDQRNDVLRRDLVDVTAKAGTQDCVILTGTFHDPYSGETIAFERGQDTSAMVQIDHVVALSDAWQKGAQQWDAATRQSFANDPLNLMASKGSVNQSKGDGDTATWLPPNRSFRCEYVARQVAVKQLYGLWVTQAEQDAMVAVLSGCPDEPLPAGGLRGAASAAPSSAAPSPAAPAEEPAVSYAGCSEARAAGAAPLHRGEPGYREAMDGDGDGVACE